MIETTENTNRKRRNMIAFRAKPAFVLGLCLLISCTSLAAISPSTTLSAANELQRAAAQDGSSAETSYDYDSAPWQPNPSHHNIDEAARYEELPPSVFSPTGRLHPVEVVVRASKAQTPLSNLLVAMVCRDGLLVVSTLPISPNVDARIESSNKDDNPSADNPDSEIKIEGNGESSPSINGKSDSNNDDDIVDTTSDDDDEALQSPSLFLFDETCISTGKGSIFDIHPCIVGATAGNAVDNRIMRTKLLALGLNALDHQGSIEQDISTARVAKDLANQLQVTTQDIAAAQKQKLGRMLAVSVELFADILE